MSGTGQGSPNTLLPAEAWSKSSGCWKRDRLCRRFSTSVAGAVTALVCGFEFNWTFHEQQALWLERACLPNSLGSPFTNPLFPTRLSSTLKAHGSG